MFLLRGVFWLALVAYLVPYKTIDLPNARFVIDQKALMSRVAALPHYCEHNARACTAAREWASALGVQSRSAAHYAANLVPPLAKRLKSGEL
jgi:hypothetical protein